MKTTLITTIFNEEKNIEKFIDSILRQTILPEEVIIVDGGSNDNSIEIINKKIKDFGKIKFLLLIKKGNRSVGRNEAIKKASNDLILSSDAGCVLDKDWVKNITHPFKNKEVEVIAGYYRGIAKTIFQKCLIPYVLVMPDKINEKNFLPATRSMAFKKNIWKKVGGFNEELSHNEDFAFANRLKDINAKIVFARNAIVDWIPRKNIKEVFVMFFRFSLGDAQAGIFRQKVLFIFIRYILGLYLLLLSLIERSMYLYIGLVGIIVLYLAWSIKKNYKYVNRLGAFFFLPIMQITSDISVITGTTLGIIQKVSLSEFLKIIFNNKGATFIILIYIFSLLSMISYGIPGLSHPFAYYMDEWHQSQSVRNLFKFGTPNISGSANGSIFQFFLTGLYLVPFYLFRIINVFAIKSSVTNLEIQHTLFEVLRLNTLIFGSLSIIVISYIGKKYFKIHSFLTAFLFTVNPLWVILGNYFKYDIALMFWILVSLIFFLRYIKSLSFVDLGAATFFSGLSLATKLSAIPLLPIYLIMFIFFTPGFYKKIDIFFKGMLIYLATFLLFGIPDIILGKGSLVEYLSSNLISSPQGFSNYYLGSNYLLYLILRLYPITFGHLFYLLFFVSFVVLVLRLISNFRSKKTKKVLLIENKYYAFFILCLFFFFLSLIPLKLVAVGNRVLVLLPFITIAVGLLISRMLIEKKLIIKTFSILLILLIVALQSAETYIWIKLKKDPDIRETSSNWIEKNIKRDTVIGIENIPIYQKIPNILLTEFYLAQYGKSHDSIYKYKIINFKSEALPKVLVLTDMDVEYKYVIKSDKNNLSNRLKKENYKLINKFEPNLKYFNLIGNQLDLYLAGLTAMPTSISIYEKK